MTVGHPKPIQHPSKVPLIVIRNDYIAICEDSPSAHCAGTILGVIEYWTTHLQKSAHHSSPLPWIYKSQQSLKEDVLGLFGLNTIHKSLQWLVDRGFLNRRRNPKNRWDKTWQYQLAADVIQPAIDEWWAQFSDTLSVNDRDIETEVSSDPKQFIENDDSKDAIQESLSESKKRVQRPTPQLVDPTASLKTKRVPKRKPIQLKEKPTASKHALIDADLKKTVASLCYPNLPAEEVLADGDEVRAITQALKSIRVKTPTLLKPEVFEQWGQWWRTHDFRGQRHQTPLPRQIVDTWMTFRNWRRGKTEQHSLPTPIELSAKRFDPITGTYLDTRRKPDGFIARNAQ